jgi:hypothetical protein
MLGEHRQVLADILWDRAQDMFNDFGDKKEESEDVEMSEVDQKKNNLNRYLHELKNLEDVTVRAKNILKKGGEKIQDFNDEMLMRIIFSFHPNPSREMRAYQDYSIKIG